MTKRQYRNYSAFFFFTACIAAGFLVSVFLKPFSIKNLVSVTLFGILIFQQLRLAFSLNRKSNELDLK